MITIEPNYNLFIQIVFVLFVLKGIIELWCGLVQADKVQKDKYGVTEILGGLITLLLFVWVMVG